MAEPGKDRDPAPSNPWTAAYEYAVDAWQRGVLYADVMRQRGNQYHQHMAKRAPNVLSMEYELVLDGREFHDLGPGDSLYFESARRHAWRNRNDGETVLIWINTPPTF